MDIKLEKYLYQVEKRLMPISVSERTDIIKEIKSTMIEMENDGVPVENIIDRLGNPSDLAKGFLGDVLINTRGFGIKRIMLLLGFYSIAGLSGIVIIPTLGIISPVFIVSGIVTLLAGVIKLMDRLHIIAIPFAENIGVKLGNGIVLSPIHEFEIILTVGLVLILVGFISWKVLKYYIINVSKTRGKLEYQKRWRVDH